MIIASNQLRAQQICHTALSAPEPSNDVCSIWYDQGQLNSGYCYPENDDLFIVRVFVHIVTQDDGTGGQSLASVNEALNRMVRDFAPHNITFSFVGIDSVRSNNFYAYNENKFSSLTATQNHTEAIDIYFIPPGIYGGGEARPFKSLVLGGGSSLYGTPLTATSLISHEMGHCLSLVHTFWPLSAEDAVYNDAFCAGLFADPCACGDFISDTAYDPASFCFTYLNNGECEYLDTDPHVALQPICDLEPFEGPNGEILLSFEYNPLVNPPINNMMSYSPWECLDHFTEGQARRMKQYLNSCTGYQDIVEENTIKITNSLDIDYDLQLMECLPDLVVESNAKLNIHVNCTFQSSSKITVKHKGKLTVNGATLSGCNDGYWQGIEVYGNPATDQLPFSSQGYVLLTNGAAVEKAVYPVRAYDGGIVRAFSTDFLECGELAFFDYAFQNYSTFQGCSFTRTADFGLPFYLTQLYLQKVNGVTVNNCHFETIQPTGVEFNGNGIVGADARFAVLNGTIIDGYYNGITGYSWGTEPWTSFRVEACTLQNNFVGVASWDVDNVVVRDNLFQKIGAHPSSGVKRGLELWNGSAFVVRDNEFIGYSSGGTRIGPSIGVLAANTGSENNEIKKNVYQDLIVANQAEFVNRGEDAEEGLQYLCNNNTSTAYDFYIWDQGIAQIQGGGDATKNTFSHPNTNATNSTYEDFNNQSINPIDYYHLNVPIETPENGYYFNINPIITTETVNCTDGVIDDDGKLTSSEEQILVQDFNTVKTAYQNQKSTYSALPPDSPYAPDLERQMTRSRDTMHRIANRIIRSELADTTGLDVTKIRTWLRNKDSRESAYRVVETYLWEGDTIAARQVRDSIPLKYELKDAQASNHNSYVQWTELKIELLNDGKDILNLDSSTVLYYQSIADTTIGRAGTQLQGLLNLGYQYNYRLNPKIPGGSQGILAPPTNGLKNKVQADFEELIAVPNPAKEFVTFRYALPENAGPAMLYIADINGKTIAQMKLQDRAGSIQWSVSHLQSGIYFYSIRYAGSTFFPRKLALIR